MITVLIAEEEERIKAVLDKVLKKEGYVISDSRGNDGSIKIVRKAAQPAVTILQTTLRELEEDLLKEREGVLYKAVMERVEKPLIEHILERTEGNQLKAARILGINRNTMRSKIRRLGISAGAYKH